MAGLIGISVLRFFSVLIYLWSLVLMMMSPVCFLGSGFSGDMIDAAMCSARFFSRYAFVVCRNSLRCFWQTEMELNLFFDFGQFNVLNFYPEVCDR